MLLLLIFTVVRPVQPENAHLPMLVTDEGIATEVRLVQSRKAYSPILVTLSPMI